MYVRVQFVILIQNAICSLDWEDDDVIQKPPRHEVLRFLYRGKFLRGATTLTCKCNDHTFSCT